jgi:peptide/nickel transport system permease protein
MTALASNSTSVLPRLPRKRAYWRRGLGPFLIKRLLLIPVSIFVVVVISFFLIAFIPSSTARAIAGEDATPERLAQITAALGLDKPIGEQFVDYLVRLSHFDLGTSFYSGLPTAQEMAAKIPASLELALPAFVLSILIGIALGTAGAFFPGKFPDRLERVWSTVLHATPEFLLGVLGIYVVFFLLGWVPAPTGRLAITDTPPPTVTGFYTIDSLLIGDTKTFGHALQRLVLPVAVLALAGSVAFARMTRAGLAESLHSNFIEFARAAGLPRHQIVRYALLDVRTPILTYVAMGLGSLIGGAAIIETLFSWPGYGAWGIAGMGSLDAPVIQSFVLVSGLLALVSYVVLDIVSVIFDPRISIEPNGSVPSMRKRLRVIPRPAPKEASV